MPDVEIDIVIENDLTLDIEIENAIIVGNSSVINCFFEDGGALEAIISIVAGEADGTYDLDAAELTNIDTVVYKKNDVVVTGEQTFVDGDTLTITITRASSGDSQVKITGTF